MPKPKSIQSTIGKSWMHRTVTYRFLSIKENGDSYDIATDSKWIHIKKSMVKTFLSDILPVEAEEHNLPSNGKSIQLAILKENSQSLVSILKDNISKVEADPGYVKQATVIQRSAKTIIELAKLELEVRKSLK